MGRGRGTRQGTLRGCVLVGGRAGLCSGESWAGCGQVPLVSQMTACLCWSSSGASSPEKLPGCDTRHILLLPGLPVPSACGAHTSSPRVSVRVPCVCVRPGALPLGESVRSSWIVRFPRRSALLHPPEPLLEVPMRWRWTWDGAGPSPSWGESESPLGTSPLRSQHPRAGEPDRGTNLERLAESQHPARGWTTGTRATAGGSGWRWEGYPVHFYRPAAILSKVGRGLVVQGTRLLEHASVCMNQ